MEDLSKPFVVACIPALTRRGPLLVRVYLTMLDMNDLLKEEC